MRAHLGIGRLEFPCGTSAPQLFRVAERIHMYSRDARARRTVCLRGILGT